MSPPRRRGDDDSGFPWDGGPSSPIPVEGGVVARTKKGPIGVTWWSERFLGALEPLTVGGRLARGKSYARKGQVTRLDVGPGAVVAGVQGTRSEPYEVRLTMPVVEAESWARILDALVAHARYAARMLAGDLPEEIEDVFTAEGESLLPGPLSRLTTQCTCPDWENPCKHIAAVCYLVAEALDEDPFLVLAWRGMAKDAVLRELGARRDALSGTRLTGQEDLAGSLEGFWEAGSDLDSIRVSPAPAGFPAALLRGAPRGVLCAGGVDLCDVLAGLYEQISVRTLRRAGLSGPDRDQPVPAQGRPAPTRPKV